MKVHIFNPEHDIALASDLDNFTAPHAGRCLRHDLGFLPALWSEPSDCILVEDVDAAKEGMRRLGLSTSAMFVSPEELTRLLKCINDDIVVRPWGWDRALRFRLEKMGMSEKCLPSLSDICVIRSHSHRAWAAEHLLKPLLESNATCGFPLVGEASELSSAHDVIRTLTEHHGGVVKAPWSSSGRGVRYVSASEMSVQNADEPLQNTQAHYIYNNVSLQPQLVGWIENTIHRQGSVMVEPYYNKVMDFGMEFTLKDDGIVTYEGLSLFQTLNGAYIGNVIDSEERKEEILMRYVPVEALHTLKEHIIEILGRELSSACQGPLGIDMMVVRTDNGLAVHPCVELNLRRTMGHVALSLGRKLAYPENRVMRITCSSQYRLRVEQTQEWS